MNELKTENLSCKRGENIVLNNINFSIKSLVLIRNKHATTENILMIKNTITLM